MVALRVVIGWHFFSEGLAHKNDPKWSSEGFLRQAKGPLAEQYRARLPSFHQWDVLLIAPADEIKHGDDTIAAGGQAEKPAGENSESNEQTAADLAKEVAKNPERSPDYGKWYHEVIHDWERQRSNVANFYKFSDEQKKASEKLLDQYQDRLKTALAGYGADINAYRHALIRNQQLTSQPGSGEIPNRSARMSKRAANPTSEPGVSNSVASSPAEWRADAEALEKSFDQELAGLATTEQLKAGPMPETMSDLKKIDTVVVWMLIIGGACLVVGLFTRLSALVLALFLLSVMASQPPWVAGAVATVFNYQLVEFVALLVLASSHVGRWAGLDFFVHHVFLRPFRSSRR